MKLLCALAALAVLAEGASVFDVVTQEWKTFKAEYGKKYNTDLEEKFRMKIFMDNRYKIAQHNARFHKGEVSFSLKLNQFSDMLHHEFLSEVTCFNQSLTYKQSLPAQGASTYIKPENVQIPDHVDWRTAGAVTRVKNQGQCGSCWAFSATGSLEGQTFRRTGNLVELSEQNLIDCSFSYGNNGCDGGIMDQAFHYIMDNGGIDTEWSYPYEAQVGACRYRPPPGATCTGYVFLPSGNEEALKIAVATIGPVSVAIDASRESFQSFHQGVYYDPACSSSELNHGVLVVGYGTDSGSDYWLVKNSWDTAWGDGGYIKMARNRGNNCGIATYATYPLV